MNYYQHHIGDYSTATKHLSLIEDAIYMRLLWAYYRDEKPLPNDLNKVAWMVGVRTKKEKTALALLLETFFVLQADGWHNLRADKEIEHYRKTQAKAKAGANARWGSKEAAPEQDTGNPQGDASDLQGKCPDDATHMPESCAGNANQQPTTNNQQPINTLSPPLKIETAPPDAAPTACVDPPGGLPAEPDKPPPEMPYGDGRPAGRLAKLLREQGVQVTPANPDFRSWVEAGLDADEIIAAVQIARTAKPKPEPIPWGYLSKVMTSQRNATPCGGITAKPKSDAHWALELAA